MPPWPVLELMGLLARALLLTCATRHAALCPAAILPEVRQLLHVIVKAIFPDCVLILDARVSHQE